MARDSKSREILIAELREQYGRLVYTHKVHEKDADIHRNKSNAIKFSQIGLSVLTTGGMVSSLMDKWEYLPLISALLSGALLFLNGYAKNFDSDVHGAEHQRTARYLWLLREQLLSLLADLEAEAVGLEQARQRRDALQVKISEVYETAPRTSGAAYCAAQKALKVDEELTFSDREIDMFLPAKLRKAKDEAAGSEPERSAPGTPSATSQTGESSTGGQAPPT